MLITVLLLFATVALSWHIPDPQPSNESIEFVRGFVACHCSPTHGSAAFLTVQEIGSRVHWLNGNYTKLQNENGLNVTEARLALRGEAKTILRSCFNHSQDQGCINADMTNRKEGQMPLCSYDLRTNRNVARLNSGEWVTEGSCPVRRQDPTPQYFKLNATRAHPGLLWCWCSPGAEILGPAQKLEEAKQHLRTVLSNLTSLPLAQASKLADVKIRQCSHQYSYAKCVEADKQLRGTYNYSMCRYDTVTGRNSGPDFMGDPDGLVTVGHCIDNADIHVLPAIAQDRGANAVVARGASKTAPKNEGCVSVRHFGKDAVLQHRWHLLRDVLCWRSFCATPNHGIYYRGVYTSLGGLCRFNNQCIKSRMLVNNLKIMVQRRYRVNHEIVVTPYDVRFPWPLIWVVQIGEDVLELVLLFIFGGIFTSTLKHVVQILMGAQK